MNFQTRQQLDDEDLKWYYQGKMLDDADEIGVYDEYLEWLSKHRTKDELWQMSDFFDGALSHVEAQPQNEYRRVSVKEHMKNMLSQ